MQVRNAATTSEAPRPARWRIGDVATAAGLTPRAIRYYEELGLLHPAEHLAGANRRYDEDDVERLRLIRRLRDVVGLSLAEVRSFLESEDLRAALRAEYLAAADASERVAILDRAEPVVRGRIDLLEQKLATVVALLDEERARLERVHTLRYQLAADDRQRTVPGPV